MDDLVQQEIEKKLGYRFRQRELLELAFVHRSYYNEHQGVTPAHNERLEFLGDAVLGLLVSDYLYHHMPQGAEGELSQLRSRVVDAKACARMLQKIDLSPYILLGKGERLNEGRGRETILADLFEAVLGAIYLDGGIVEVHRVFWNLFEKEIKMLLQEKERNWKAELQDYAQKKYQKPPTYRVLAETGPDHSKRFAVAVALSGVDMGSGEGMSKKQAEQAAAEDALMRMDRG